MKIDIEWIDKEFEESIKKFVEEEKVELRRLIGETRYGELSDNLGIVEFECGKIINSEIDLKVVTIFHHFREDQEMRCLLRILWGDIPLTNNALIYEYDEALTKVWSKPYLFVDKSVIDMEKETV